MFNKEKTKHYIKRAINKVKYTDIRDNTLCFDGFSTNYPEIELYYSVGEKKFTNKIIYRVCDEDAFNALEYDSWAALLTHVAFLLSPVFFKYDQFDFIKCTFGCNVAFLKKVSKVTCVSISSFNLLSLYPVNHSITSNSSAILLPFFSTFVT